LTIKDLDSCKDSLISANGTLIDGKKISPRQNTKLKHNNKVSFGDSKKYLIVKGSII
jgi:pSer/pThr/pTyr-binding forkhead associated (FHA) protein